MLHGCWLCCYLVSSSYSVEPNEQPEQATSQKFWQQSFNCRGRCCERVSHGVSIYRQTNYFSGRAPHWLVSFSVTALKSSIVARKYKQEPPQVRWRLSWELSGANLQHWRKYLRNCRDFFAFPVIRRPGHFASREVRLTLCLQMEFHISFSVDSCSCRNLLQYSRILSYFVSVALEK